MPKMIKFLDYRFDILCQYLEIKRIMLNEGNFKRTEKVRKNQSD